MNFTPNPNYELPNEEITWETVLTADKRHAYTTTMPWKKGTRPTKEDIDKYCNGFVSKAAIDTRDQLLKYYGYIPQDSSPYAPLIYDFE